jgi:hypothetical protein
LYFLSIQLSLRLDKHLPERTLLALNALRYDGMISEDEQSPRIFGLNESQVKFNELFAAAAA